MIIIILLIIIYVNQERGRIANYIDKKNCFKRKLDVDRDFGNITL
jgi:hypothetical protein